MSSFLRTPHGLLLSFGGALLTVAAFTIWDASLRNQREAIVTPTGAGDRSFFQPPPELNLATEVLRQQQRPYFLVQLSPQKKSDVEMLPAGRDDLGSTILYRHLPRGHKEATDERRYVKVAPQRYLILSLHPATGVTGA